MKKTLMYSFVIAAAVTVGYMAMAPNDGLQTNYYPAIRIGDYGDDWLSISGNKVQDVRSAEDSIYIYLWDNMTIEHDSVIKVEQLRLLLFLEGDTLQGDTLYSPDEPATRVVDFVSDTMPNGEAWTIQKFNLLEIGIADHPLNFTQSYLCRRQIPGWPPPTWDIQSAGVRVTIQNRWEVLVPFQMITSLKMEKVLNYYD